MSAANADPFDLLVVGGGINGVAVARDAAGRGLSVLLVERGDLAGATSSATSKLIHGGLRYLEQREFRLVREALHERELLLRNAPHLVHPLEFVLPHARGMRPRWLVRAGLFLYGRLAGRSRLPRPRALSLPATAYGAPLQAQYRHGFLYPDAWTDDARLTILTARDAAARGAQIRPRTEFLAAARRGGLWEVQLSSGSARARAIANVAGPWVAEVLERTGSRVARRVRLVKGSHVVVPRLYPGMHAYLLQNTDRRVVFLIPFHESWTLIGTTDVPIAGPPEPATCSPEEVEYLCRAAGRFLAQAVDPSQVVWSFAGVRPLLDDGRREARTVTRDYRFELDDDGGVPLLHVFGGKLTTHRRLGERALDALQPYFPEMGPHWTAGAPLPGALEAEPQRPLPPGLPNELLSAWRRRHGGLAGTLLHGVQGIADLGRHFGGTLYERELRWFLTEEWARTAEDVLWRRTKEGLRFAPEQIDGLQRYLESRPL